MTNLIHWMVLHSPLVITEHHHHNKVDLFPDFKRRIPFGTGTSVGYNYLDYQFKNSTDAVFQLIVYATDTHLCGELRCSREIDSFYHIIEKKHCFTQESDGLYRNNEIYRKTINKETGICTAEELIIKNHSRVLYDSRFIDQQLNKQ